MSAVSARRLPGALCTLHQCQSARTASTPIVDAKPTYVMLLVLVNVGLYEGHDHEWIATLSPPIESSVIRAACCVLRNAYGQLQIYRSIWAYQDVVSCAAHEGGFAQLSRLQHGAQLQLQIHSQVSFVELGSPLVPL